MIKADGHLMCQSHRWAIWDERQLDGSDHSDEGEKT
jgi:hypothetical protein